MGWTNHWLPILANYSQFLSGFGIFSGLVMLYRRHNCHIRRCWRLQWRVVQGTDHVVCRRHHPGKAPTHREMWADVEAAAGRLAGENRIAAKDLRTKAVGYDGAS